MRMLGSFRLVLLAALLVAYACGIQAMASEVVKVGLNYRWGVDPWARWPNAASGGPAPVFARASAPASAADHRRLAVAAKRVRDLPELFFEPDVRRGVTGSLLLR